MRTLLVVTRHPPMATAIEAVLDAGQYQIIAKEDLADAEFLLTRGAIDAAILDLELTDARAIRAITELKSLAPSCPVLVYANNKQWEWEEDAYLHGVQHVLSKPVRGKLLNALLQRVLPLTDATDHGRNDTPSLEPAPVRNAAAAPLSHDGTRSLESLRRFSSVMAHALDAGPLLREFLLLLREVIGVNRAIVFLRKPATLLAENPLAPEDRWLRSACAIGLDQSVLDHFALSLGAGIGGYLHRHGRILRATAPDAQQSREITKEFQILGAQVAVPLLDRHSLIGIAVFDERLTGEPYAPAELALLFHLLEEVGMAIRHSWLHSQIKANHAMITEILSRLGSGCLVVDGSMTVLHANKAAQDIFLAKKPNRTAVEFGDLPQQLGSMVFTAIKTGVGVPAFKHQFPTLPDSIYRISIIPFTTNGSHHPDAALLTIEDITEHERAQRLDTEAANLRMIKAMSEHLAHEIGNALVPISTHQQLIKEQIHEAEFQESLTDALAAGVKRISRLASQMNFLAREWNGDFPESVPVSDLIVEAFHEANTYNPGKKLAQLSFNKNTATWKVAGDHKALRHAFSEIILNALQANPDAPTIAVDLQETPGAPELQVEVRDSGSGFTAESASRAAEPFFSTRNVGLGIGLTVTRKIIESHHGRLEIPTPRNGTPGVVRVSLPIQN